MSPTVSSAPSYHYKPSSSPSVTALPSFQPSKNSSATTTTTTKAALQTEAPTAVSQMVCVFYGVVLFADSNNNCFKGCDHFTNTASFNRPIITSILIIDTNTSFQTIFESFH
jgi:hypothetical protein